MPIEYKIDEIRHDDEIASAAGRRIVEVLGLSPDCTSKGLYGTQAGLKTHAGLARLVLEEILDDE